MKADVADHLSHQPPLVPLVTPQPKRPPSLIYLNHLIYKAYETITLYNTKAKNIMKPIPVLFLGFKRYRDRVRSRLPRSNETETWSRTPKSPRLQRDETETRSLAGP